MHYFDLTIHCSSPVAVALLLTDAILAGLATVVLNADSTTIIVDSNCGIRNLIVFG